MKSAHVVGAYQTDVNLAISWLKLNRAINVAGDCEKQGSVYVCPIRMLKSKKQVADLLLARFGHFVRIR